MKNFKSDFFASFTALIGVIATLLGMIKIDEIYTKIILLIIFILLVFYVSFILFKGRKNKAYKSLLGKWHAYHITKDLSINDAIYWQEGKVNIDKIDSTLEVTATQSDLNESDNEYLMKGTVSKGRILLLAENKNPHLRDGYSVYFHNLQKNDIIIGYWMGENLDQNPTVAPYILSRDNKEAQELNKLASLNRINFLEHSPKLKVSINRNEK